MEPRKTIVALYDDKTITVYQACNDEIADAAVATQKLSASPKFKINRTTWIKPSWCWMMYRCGYSSKDPNQHRVLALRMKHTHFAEVLKLATLAHDSHVKGTTVVVQWDPERGPRLERFADQRSIQIGIPGVLVQKWSDEWIDSIHDVTAAARAMKEALDEDEKLTAEQLVHKGLMPQERSYVVDAEIIKRLGMRLDTESGRS
ncbi:hypothetical protein BAUCODRAFT_67475 [Baudoinia panamericana UAMH 10762]|uniref:ATP-dependent RNA helicase DHX8 n=1 Tax=Baudoinia panamericana (strain UAMH 10762) TaxID=717646 RepID=M2NF59_BAUPA|nr:uncharacterized protein BAUCODRAFT_67475 [Baudoinia panamericana UAMH 10762]EMC97889.1 hypothetical protein BAUCODRAFT_67475 [Baudoinia panamericana UAMH 10762]